MLSGHRNDATGSVICVRFPDFSRALYFRQNAGRTLLWPLLFGGALTGSALLPVALAAPPLPQNGQFVAGSGSIARNGPNLDITQSSSRGIIDWRGFSIGAGRSVSIVNGTGATLNRVTGSSASLLDGRLTSTGSVYVVNPQGVVVGPNGTVTTGGRFVASTLDVGNDAFMQSGALMLTGTSSGSVVNLGSISSTDGDVFLVSSKAVVNLGSIKAANGTVELAAGTKVLLHDSSMGQQVFVQAGSGAQTLNAGAIRAAQVSLRATGTETRDGHVWLVADGGGVDARNATVSAKDANGRGGTVDVSASTLKIDGAKIDAAQWNLTAPTFTIGRSTANTLSRNLSDGTSVTVNTTGAEKTAGDIGVQSGIEWRGASMLTLNAFHSITIAPSTKIANRGAGNLTLRADAASNDNGGSITNTGAIDWSQSTGIFAALYDMNGTYAPDTVLTNAGWSAAPFGGLLTQATSYRLVNSLDDLAAISQDMAGVYALGTNLGNANATQLTRFISLGGATGLAFTGQFDGFGHTIGGLAFEVPSASSLSLGGIGLFSSIGAAGVVRNVNIVDGSVGTIFGSAGLLAGVNAGLITYASSSGDVSAGSFGQGRGGGLVGQNDGTIERSSSSARVGSQAPTGGLVGLNNGLITESFATGDIYAGSHGLPGGLVGANSSTGVIEKSYSTGSSTPLLQGGGLVGSNAGAIRQSFVAQTDTGFVFPGAAYGGIAGVNSGMIAADVFWNTQTDVNARGRGVNIGTPVADSVALSTQQMSTPASFGPTWDFGVNGTWVIPAGATHPILQWQASTQGRAP
jgi:filamentous hemagglutinin family protein